MAPEVLEMDKCIDIGEKVCDRIIDNIIKTLNTKHSSVNGMPFVTNLALELYQNEGVLEDFDPEVAKDIKALIETEYNKLDELEQHCVFLYSELPDNNKSEILSIIQWWLEEQIGDMGISLVNMPQNGSKMMS